MYSMNILRLNRENLLGNTEALHAERVKMFLRSKEIDEQMTLLGKIGDVLGIDIGTTVKYAAEHGVPDYARL